MQHRLPKKIRNTQQTRQEQLAKALHKGDIPSNMKRAFDRLFGQQKTTFDRRDDLQQVPIGGGGAGRRMERLSAKCDPDNQIIQPYGPVREHDKERRTIHGFVLSLDLGFIDLRLDKAVLLVLHLTQYLLRHPGPPKQLVVVRRGLPLCHIDCTPGSVDLDALIHHLSIIGSIENSDMISVMHHIYDHIPEVGDELSAYVRAIAERARQSKVRCDLYHRDRRGRDAFGERLGNTLSCSVPEKNAPYEQVLPKSVVKEIEDRYRIQS